MITDEIPLSVEYSSTEKGKSVVRLSRASVSGQAFPIGKTQKMQ